jgi:hypothetical protein
MHNPSTVRGNQGVTITLGSLAFYPGVVTG